MTPSDESLRHLAQILDPDPQPGSDATNGDEPSHDDDIDDLAASAADTVLGPDDVDHSVVATCAELDHSDTANGERLRRHFGRDLAVLQTEGERSSHYLAWTGTHWDASAGNDLALKVAQKVGAVIKLEAEHLALLPHEDRVLAKALCFADVDDDDLTPEQEDIRREAKAVPKALARRKVSRRGFGVTTRNGGRLNAMLACAAPHLCRHPDGFNADPLLVATLDHTLRFTTAPGETEGTTLAFCDATAGHSREDWITKVVPVAYDPEATAPLWTAFLQRFLPVPAVRDCVQTFSGLGLLGTPLQNLLFHYGLGANGKSVFMETLSRILGPLSVDLPAESLMGVNERAGAGASPDLARLYCARTVRVSELPANSPVREDLVKKLTGGERIPVRNLFKGFFDFKPIFKAHLSGNSLPRIDGTDDGIWRRMGVIEWPIKIPVEERRPFEEVVGGLTAEAPGILNWLIAGALTYLEQGFTLPPEVLRATKDYRDEMDPIGQFVGDCVEEALDESVTAREMYDGYVAWSLANAKKPLFEQKFGRVMKTRFRRADERIRRYLDCRLHDVPPSSSRNPEGPWDR